MKFDDLFRLTASYCTALLALTFFTPQAAHAITWNEPYAYSVQGQNLKSTLQAFASAQNLALDINPQVDLTASTGNGWIRGENGPAFLNALAARNNLSWFVFERILYISVSSDVVTKRVVLRTGSPENAREALTAVGLFDARFGWGPLTDQGAVLVSGPSQYVARVERFLSMAPAPQPKRSSTPISNQTLMSFHLRYAPVADRVISACSQHTVTPGAASVLRDLLQSSSTPATVGQAAPTGPAPMPASIPFQQSLGAGLMGSLGMGGPTMPEPMMASSPPSEPTIVADVRTNTLLIRDLPSRRALYRQLIKTLDVPLPQITLEALMLEFDEAGRQQLCTQTGLCFGDNSETNGEAVAALPKARGADFDRALSALLTPPQNTPAEAPSLELLMRQRVVTLENQLAALTINRNLYEESRRAIQARDNKVGGAPKRNDANQLCVRPGRLDDGRIALEIDMALEGWKSMSGMAMEATSQAVLQTQIELNDDEPIVVATSTIDTRPGHMRAVVLWVHRRPVSTLATGSPS